MTRTTTDGRVERARRFTRAVLETSVGEARRGRLTIAFLTPDKPPAPRARIVSTDEATPAYRAKHEGYGFTKDTIAQLVAYSVEEPGPGGPRLRRVAASEAPGDRIAAICNLFDDGATAEIDDV